MLTAKLIYGQLLGLHYGSSNREQIALPESDLRTASNEAKKMLKATRKEINGKNILLLDNNLNNSY